VRSFGATDLYRVVRDHAPALRDEVLARGRAAASTTLEGTPLAPLPPECRAARLLAVGAPEQLLTIPLPRPVRVRFANDSGCRWPALGVRPEGLVGLTYRWISPEGEARPRGPVSRLLHDVAPGATVDTTLMLAPPPFGLGSWRLEVLLLQEGLEAPLASATFGVELRAPQKGAEGALQPLPGRSS
jgi:hypothetical protein